MNRAEKIIELYTRFVDNYEHFGKHNDEVLVDCEFEKWHSLLEHRSKCQRDIFSENEAILAEAKELMSTPIESKEEADEILVFYRKLVNTRSFDYSLFSILYQPLFDFYTSTGDDLRLIGLYVTTGAVIMTEFNAEDKSFFPIDAKECALKAIECSKRLDPTENTDIWVSVFSAYANLLGSLTYAYEELNAEFMSYYKEAMAYFDDPVIGKAIDATPRGAMFRALIEGRIIYGHEAYDYMSEEDKLAYVNEVKRQLKSPEKEFSEAEIVLMNSFIGHRIGEVDGRIAFEKLMEELIKMDPKFEVQDVVITAEDFMDCLYLIDAMFKVLRTGVFTEEEVYERVEILRSKMKILLSLAPYAYMTEYVNFACASFCAMLAPYLHEEQELISTIRSLLILRQPITYIHTLMVRKIANAIAETMLEKKPELFIPLFGENVAEVKSRHDEIIDYVSKAAMLHDLGKNKIASVINNQYRRITDDEFNLIKQHPNLGTGMFLTNTCLEKYYDVMRGHHKTYDGKGGYPADFDNTKSPYRIVIDLITIADCTDAATDILGRNYARGKDFSMLLEELKKDKGTRYNPDIVDLIADSPELCAELNMITGDGRRRTYYHAYRHVMNLEHI